jgi:hypothetical protein
MDVWVCRGCGGVVPLDDATCPVCGGDREGRSSIVFCPAGTDGAVLRQPPELAERKRRKRNLLAWLELSVLDGSGGQIFSRRVPMPRLAARAARYSKPGSRSDRLRTSAYYWACRSLNQPACNSEEELAPRAIVLLGHHSRAARHLDSARRFAIVRSLRATLSTRVNLLLVSRQLQRSVSSLQSAPQGLRLFALDK